MRKKKETNLDHSQARILPRRMDKTLDWLEQSRDVWKNKCIEAKSDLKMKTLKVKRLRDGKDLWKLRLRESTKEIRVIKNARDAYSKEIERLKAELNAKDLEIAELKKKHSCIRRK